jgi:hypothetical protein
MRMGFKLIARLLKSLLYQQKWDSGGYNLNDIDFNAGSLFSNNIASKCGVNQCNVKAR